MPQDDLVPNIIEAFILSLLAGLFGGFAILGLALDAIFMLVVLLPPVIGLLMFPGIVGRLLGMVMCCGAGYAGLRLAEVVYIFFTH